MDLAAIMDAIADALGSITGLRAYGWPLESIAPPAVIVGYPESIDYDYTFGGTKTEATFPAWLVVGRVSDRTARDTLSSYLSVGGASELKAELDGDLGGACDTARVVNAAPDYIDLAGVPYLAARLDIHVIA
jgi:hypothetical protein